MLILAQTTRVRLALQVTCAFNRPIPVVNTSAAALQQAITQLRELKVVVLSVQLRRASTPALKETLVQSVVIHKINVRSLLESVGPIHVLAHSQAGSLLGELSLVKVSVSSLAHSCVCCHDFV